MGASQQIKAANLAIAVDSTLMGAPDQTVYQNTYNTCLGVPPSTNTAFICSITAGNATSADLGKRADAVVLALYNLNPAQADQILLQNKLFLKVN